MVKYAIEIKLPVESIGHSTEVDDLRPQETSQIVNNNTKRTKEVIEEEKRKQERKETVSAVAKGVAYTASAVNYAANLYTTHKENTYALQGDFVAADNLSRKSAIYSEVGNTGLALGLGFATGGLAGGAAMASALALSYAKRALELAEQQRVYRAEGQKEQFEYSLNRDRMIRSYAGLR